MMMQKLILKKPLKVIAAICVFAVTLSSCKKEADAPVVPPVVTPSKDFVVNFSNASVPVTQVDSAVIVVRDQNQFIKKWEKMQLSSSSIRFTLANLTTGNYTAEILIYTKKQTDGTARQYAITKTFALPLDHPIDIDAPIGSFNDQWFKRAVFFADQNAALAIVAMDPRDGFYEVRFKEAKWIQTGLERASVDGNVLVAMKDHKKALDAKVISFAEYSAFDSYKQNMAGKSWTRAYISMYLGHESGNDIYFDYEYTRD